MKHCSRLFLLYIVISYSANGQLTLKNPAICHDADGYLKCFNDGKHIATFSNGNLKEFRTADGLFWYTDADKTINFCNKSWDMPSQLDTVQIKLLPKSVLLTRKGQTLTIDSLKNLPTGLRRFFVGPWSDNGYTRGLTFYSGDRFFRIIISTYPRNWSWDIAMFRREERFVIAYNAYKENRFERMFIDDDSLRYGWAFSTTFKSSKKLWQLETLYVDTLRYVGESPVIGAVPQDKNYYYEYDRAGKLKNQKTVGELKLCNCD